MPSIMHAMIATMAGQMRTANAGLYEAARVAAGMSLMASAFLIAQTLLFVEERWWRE